MYRGLLYLWSNTKKAWRESNGECNREIHAKRVLVDLRFKITNRQLKQL